MSDRDSSAIIHTTGAPESRQARAYTQKPRVEPGAWEPRGTFLFVRHPTPGELTEIYATTVREIGEMVAGFDVVKSVYGRNPFSFWAYLRASDETRRDAQLAGFCAFLPLSVAGVAALRSGILSARLPDPAHIARQGDELSALYIWAIVAHGVADLGGKLVAHAMGLDVFERTPIYGTVGTEAGRDALRKRNNSPQAGSAEIGTFFEIRHPPAFLAEMRALDVVEGTNTRPGARRPRLEAKLAATPSDIAKVFALRAAVFMAEQDCPYEEEFDGNDYAGAHVLGLVDGMPAAVLRIRYFADFVKLERLAVLPRFRRTLIAQEVVDQAIAICRRKGYTKMYGHAQKRLVDLWSRFGFVPMNKNTPLVFSDHEYVEMLGEIVPHHAPLTPFSDPYTLVRPEGSWDLPGVLDFSRTRPPRNPHRDRQNRVTGS